MVKPGAAIKVRHALPARTSRQGQDGLPRSARRQARFAVAACIASVAVMTVVAALGPSAAVPSYPSASPWPPWSADADPSPGLVTIALWAALLLGAAGLIAGLLAARSGWRPRASRLIAGSFVAVAVLTVTPPLASTDMLDYAIYGRITVLGASPYQMTPLQLKAAGDPVGAVAPVPWERDPSVYGPLATATEWAAAELGGASAARTLFWLKVWNGLAYLALVLGLDRLVRSDAELRVRAHLLWSVNPLMLYAGMAGGHIDVLSAALGFCAVVAVRPGRGPGSPPRRGMLGGLLAGAAAAVKAPMLLVAGGLAWLARRSPRVLAATCFGALAVLLPCYLIAGRAGLVAVWQRAAGSPSVYDPPLALSRALRLDLGNGTIDLLAALVAVILAVILLRRMPAGPTRYPLVGPALALLLAWVIATPQQRPWYDMAIFPLLALMPATRLDWVAVVRAAAAALAEVPGVTYYPLLVPAWLSDAGKTISVVVSPVILIGACIAVIWMCTTGKWGVDDSHAPGPLVGITGLTEAAPPARARKGRPPSVRP